MCSCGSYGRFHYAGDDKCSHCDARLNFLLMRVQLIGDIVDARWTLKEGDGTSDNGCVGLSVVRTMMASVCGLLCVGVGACMGALVFV